MSQPLLCARQLDCERDGRTLFVGLDLEVAAGEIVEVLGANGAGKSTLLRVLAGLLPDYQGEVRGAADCLYLGHRTGLSPGLTPLQNLMWFTALANGGGADGPSLLRALKRVGLEGYEDVPCQQLSAGQQRRAALARLLLGDAKLWLLDEPATALDDAANQLLLTLLQEHVVAGGAAVIATHTRLTLAEVLVRALHLPYLNLPYLNKAGAASARLESDERCDASA